jgi:TetR/AcrR family transcriptional regulator, cholesterol catabolism regulator
MARQASAVPVRPRLHRYYAALAQMNEGERELTRMLHLSLQHDEVLAHQRPVPEAVLTAILRGQDQGEFNPYADPSLAAEVLTAVYFDTLSRWLTEAEPPFDLSGGLADKLDLVLAGLTVPPPRKRT